MRRPWTPIAMLAILALCWAPALAQPVMLSDESGASLVLEGESVLEVVGVTGSIVLRGAQGDLRYEARTLDNRREDHQVALWLEGSTLRLTPLEGDEGLPMLIEIGVPSRLDVVVRCDGCRVHASAIAGHLDIDGSRIELEARAIYGGATLRIDGGSINVNGADADLEIEGKGLGVNVQNVRASVFLALESSHVDIATVGESVEGELEGSSFVGTGLEGLLRLDVAEGSVDLAACNGGGELYLTDSPLVLDGTKGILDVETDAEVEFHGHEGGLKITGRGAAVTGDGTQGLLEIETDEAEVRLENLTGTSKIFGHGLELTVTASRGELELQLTSSSVRLDRCVANITVENDFGDVEIISASQLVKITTRDGDVRLTDFKGSLQLAANGPAVEVAWSAIETQQDSSIENEGGNVRLTLPSTASCKIEADAPYGRIESDLKELQVADDGHSATLNMNSNPRAPHVKRPLIRVRSDGELWIGTGGRGN